MDTSAVSSHWRVLEKLLKEVREQNRTEQSREKFKEQRFFAEEN